MSQIPGPHTTTCPTGCWYTKKRLLAESGLPTQMYTKVLLVHDKSITFKKQKTNTIGITAAKNHNKLAPPQLTTLKHSREQ